MYVCTESDSTIASIHTHYHSDQHRLYDFIEFEDNIRVSSLVWEWVSVCSYDISYCIYVCMYVVAPWSRAWQGRRSGRQEDAVRGKPVWRGGRGQLVLLVRGGGVRLLGQDRAGRRWNLEGMGVRSALALALVSLTMGDIVYTYILSFAHIWSAQKRLMVVVSVWVGLHKFRHDVAYIHTIHTYSTCVMFK